MLRFFLLILSLFPLTSSGEEFRDIVERYKNINQEKIKSIALNRQLIKGVEIVIADRAENMASRFGHGLLRLVDNDDSWFNDAVISFSALTYEKSYSVSKSIVGGYEVLPQVQTFFEFWKQYTKKEERDLKRYVISLDENELQTFLDTLFTHLENPELLDSYTFFSNNCIGVISKIFIKAGLTKEDNLARIPSKVSHWIEKNGLSLYPELVIKNPGALHRKVQGLDLNQMTLTEMKKIFTPDELCYLYFHHNHLSEEKVDEIAAFLRQEDIDLNDTFSFSPIHHSLYADFKKEASHLSNEDLKKVIIYRLENHLHDQLKHLNFSTEIIHSLKTSGNRLQSVKKITEGHSTHITLRLRDSRQKKMIVKKLHLPEALNDLAIVPKKSSVEIMLISF